MISKETQSTASVPRSRKFEQCRSFSRRKMIFKAVSIVYRNSSVKNLLASAKKNEIEYEWLGAIEPYNQAYEDLSKAALLNMSECKH